MNRFTIGKVILLAAGAAAVTAYLKDEKFKASTEKALNDIKDTVVKVGKDVADISKDYIEQIKHEFKSEEENECCKENAEQKTECLEEKTENQD
ncbi:MAG: hypothetical protein PUD22_00065 [Erysipelotrichaceae bacterium]|nr:hypothetical protein [Erysipelotrichaceae bacterium]